MENLSNTTKFPMWTYTLSGLGGVGAVIWGFQHHAKGKFWYFLLGSTVGATIGYVIDNATA